MHGHALQVADFVYLTIGKQVVELGAIALEFIASVKNLAKGLLHRGDMLANRSLAAEKVFEIGTGGEMIGVDMALDDPLHVQFLLLNIANDCLGTAVAYPPRGHIKIQDRIDNGTSH